MTSEAASRASYHHGDARNALLHAATELLETTGAAGLSLRQLAERAGLSRQAPYNHFADKQALLAELVREGFEHLGRTMRASGDDARSPTARLRDAAEGYIAFAQNSPALFRLMFSKEIVDLSRYPSAKQAASASFSELHAIVGAMAPPECVADVSLVAWSLVHGYATLCIEAGIEQPDERHSRATLFGKTIAALIPTVSIDSAARGKRTPPPVPMTPAAPGSRSRSRKLLPPR